MPRERCLDGRKRRLEPNFRCMQSPLMRMSQIIRNSRRRCRLSQRQLAAAIGCSQSYVAQIERMRRPVSPRVAQFLEGFFELGEGSLTGPPVVFSRGRPALSAVAKVIHRGLQRANGGPVQDWPSRRARPRYPRYDYQYGLNSAFPRVGIWCGKEAKAELELLQDLRGIDEEFWRKSNLIRSDSLVEKRAQIGLGLLAEQVTGVSWEAVGCQLLSAHGTQGYYTGKQAHPAFLISQRDLVLACFPQRCVRTQRGYRWPDLVVVAARENRKITVVIEINGPKYHTNPMRERRRDAELGVPVLHVCASRVEAHLPLDIIDWIASQFEAA